nr:aspartate aminotransferase family protein [Marinicella sp. W31]MDC2878799.1 aspartate aminotransferase family protein [Marinicella sp. W31]
MSGISPLFNTFARIPLRFERGEGVWLVSDKGERYLDFAAGIAVNSLGHAHPHLVAALQDQAEKLWHVSNLYQVPGQERLAERLTQATFADKVFFSNSGAEALEAAIKTARRYHYSRGNPEKIDIVTFEGAFHGRTLATIAAGGQAKYMEGFGPKAPGFVQIPAGDLDLLKETVGETTAALMIEPIQGEGGVRTVDKAFLQALRALCDEQGLLLIFDEVQTGVGRTGTLFAYEQTGVAPDIMAIAKGIGSGFPVGACLATNEAASAMVPGVHGTTFGGNPLAMAVGNAVLDVVLEDGFLAHVREMGLLFRQGLAEIQDRYPDVIEEIRGEGLMVGVKAKVPAGALVEAMRDEKLLSVPAGDNVVRLLPPLTVSDEEVRDGLARLSRAAAKLSVSPARSA